MGLSFVLVAPLKTTRSQSIFPSNVSRFAVRRLRSRAHLLRSCMTPTKPSSTEDSTDQPDPAQTSSRNSPAIVQIGCGTDLHGQDVTVASVRACRNAIEFNSLPILTRFFPGGDLTAMRVHVQLGIPKEFHDSVDLNRIYRVFPYGTVSVTLQQGGLICSSGIVLPEQGDSESDDRAIVAVAAVSVIL